MTNKSFTLTIETINSNSIGQLLRDAKCSRSEVIPREKNWSSNWRFIEGRHGFIYKVQRGWKKG